MEVEDEEGKRPDFSLISSNQQLEKLYSVGKKKNGRAFPAENESKKVESFEILKKEKGKKDGDFPEFSFLKYYVKAKMKERHPFHILCKVDYEVVDENEEVILSETTSCKLDILKASLPISINKILQRTGHIHICLNHLKKSEKKDRIQTRKDYMMYLYVTSILKRESLLVSHLSFKAGASTILKKEIQWQKSDSEEITLRKHENDQHSREFWSTAQLLTERNPENLEKGA